MEFFYDDDLCFVFCVLRVRYVQILTGERQEFKYFRADGAENVQSCTRGGTMGQDRNHHHNEF